ncbi:MULTISPECIES: catalase KatA [Priestia]|jgi:catalase|uniref:Catalase n=6 Tax=Priestia megaterium TaxID=1404 RepID=A0ABD4WQK8_PRIMG|nr:MULTISPECIES: catalase KatA [Priestia]KQU21482.1 catalase [Bacillus sp. Leaf75]KRF47392.1 catalase [Bacillus sp. Soil531]MCF6799092.1 catalase KatA [Bacillus sp. ET1]MDH6651764.1 catalase [Bacillus sp. PvP124]MEB2276493.1 catalase KatA [Bacillus sp. ILBB4]RFB22716.1 catalase [Bacillus sp. ALD]RFB35027.1 catalase [Bacillus sp. RC]
MTTNKNNLTTSWGAPVGDNQNSMTAGSRGPTLIQDVHLLEKLAHFNRERVPERVVHAKGAGAHGYFEVTNDVSAYTKAAFLSEVGKRTPLFVRFSTVAGENGSADTVRDPRGFAVKFYTEEGNYDLVGNNTPVFFIRDAIKFPDFIHTQKRDPRTHLKNPTAVWDFWSLSPESLHQVSILMSDRGIPATLRHMHGFGSHTFKWVNAEGDGVWVKYHFKTEQGVKNLSPDVAAKLAGENPDYHTEDLFNAIEKGDFPSWKLYVQIMPLEDADTYRFDPFDVTKVWSQKDYPLIEVGRMVLDRNPENYFAEVEQATFSPGTLVPGIDVSPDKMLQGRLFAYSDAHRYRVGANHQALPINRPRNEVNNYQRDGQMRFDDNGGRSVYYEPNSFGGPTESHENKQAAYPVSGVADSVAYDHNDHYTQAGDLYRLLSEDERTRLVANIVEAMKPVEKEEIKLRQIQHFYKADPEYGTRVADGLGLSVPQQVK